MLDYNGKDYDAGDFTPTEPIKIQVRKPERHPGRFAGKVVAVALAVALGGAAVGVGYRLGGGVYESLFNGGANVYAEAPAQAADTSGGQIAADSGGQSFTAATVSPTSGNNPSPAPAAAAPAGGTSSAIHATTSNDSGASLGGESENLVNVVKAVANSVVSINVTINQRAYGQIYQQQGAASGIVYAEDNNTIYIATNNHVVDGVSVITVSLDDLNEVQAKVIGTDPSADLALLSVSKADAAAAKFTGYQVATFGDSTKVEVGEMVVAIGNALGEGKSATHGIISAVNKSITVGDVTLNTFQTDAAINPGNSGGALVNMAGQVIGINCAKLSDYDVEGMGYSIPGADAINILNQIAATGSIQRPTLGVSTMDISQTIRDIYALPSVGAMVTSVDGSNASAAGFVRGDIIVSINNKTVTTADDINQALTKLKVGDTVVVSVYRGTKLMNLQVQLAAAASN